MTNIVQHAHHLAVSIPVGTMAAIMTGLEYLLSVLCGLSLRASVHGFWLIGLHRGGEASLTGATHLRRAFIRDMLVTLIGIWLVTGVALVESNLRGGFSVDDNVVNSALAFTESICQFEQPFTSRHIEQSLSIESSKRHMGCIAGITELRRCRRVVCLITWALFTIWLRRCVRTKLWM